MRPNQIAIAICSIVAWTLGCTSQEPIQPSVQELSGTKADRASAIARLLPTVAPYAELSDAIEDAYLIEQKFGDGVLGPADYCSYFWIAVPPEQVGRWKSVLQPITKAPPYEVPPTNPSWWLTPADFDLLPKYDPFPLFQRDGWIAVDARGAIFARTCTR